MNWVIFPLSSIAEVKIQLSLPASSIFCWNFDILPVLGHMPSEPSVRILPDASTVPSYFHWNGFIESTQVPTYFFFSVAYLRVMIPVNGAPMNSPRFSSTFQNPPSERPEAWPLIFIVWPGSAVHSPSVDHSPSSARSHSCAFVGLGIGGWSWASTRTRPAANSAAIVSIVFMRIPSTNQVQS